MRICIVGCGRVGFSVAEQLSRKGLAVVMVDRSERALRALEAKFGGLVVLGDATRMEVLDRAQVRGADALIAVTENDNVNLMVALVARRLLGVDRVVARIADPVRTRLFEELGVEPICATTLVAGQVLHHVMSVGIGAST